jgi:flagellar biosynthesis component FlhA
VTSEIIAALVGAGIALVSGIVGALLYHFLSLRANTIKRKRTTREEQARREQHEQEERTWWQREKENEAEKTERAAKVREVERLREVLLESVSTRLAPQDLEKFLEEVEKKYYQDGWKWADRPPEDLENWLRERQRRAGQEPSTSKKEPEESSD